MPLPSPLLNLLLGLLPPACGDQEAVKELAQYVLASWVAPWYPLPPPAPWLQTLQHLLARLQGAGDNINTTTLLVQVHAG